MHQKHWILNTELYIPYLWLAHRRQLHLWWGWLSQLAESMPCRKSPCDKRPVYWSTAKIQIAELHQARRLAAWVRKSVDWCPKLEAYKVVRKSFHRAQPKPILLRETREKCWFRFMSPWLQTCNPETQHLITTFRHGGGSQIPFEKQVSRTWWGTWQDTQEGLINRYPDPVEHKCLPG